MDSQFLLDDVLMIISIFNLFYMNEFYNFHEFNYSSSL